MCWVGVPTVLDMKHFDHVFLFGPAPTLTFLGFLQKKVHMWFRNSFVRLIFAHHLQNQIEYIFQLTKSVQIMSLNLFCRWFWATWPLHHQIGPSSSLPPHSFPSDVWGQLDDVVTISLTITHKTSLRTWFAQVLQVGGRILNGIKHQEQKLNHMQSWGTTGAFIYLSSLLK